MIDAQPPFQHYARLAQECVQFSLGCVGRFLVVGSVKRRKTEGCWDLMRFWNSGGDGFNYCWGLVQRGGGDGCVCVCARRGFAVCLRVGVHTLLQEHAEIHCLWCSLLCGLSLLSPTLFPLLPCPSYPVSLQLIVTAQNFVKAMVWTKRRDIKRLNFNDLQVSVSTLWGTRGNLSVKYTV